MEMLINNPALLRKLILRRRATGADRFDEVWDGVYIVSPLADDEHQQIDGKLYIAIDAAIQIPGLGEVRNGTNVSDREDDWRKNYRCPDVAVFLNGSTAVCKGAYWLGGPDFATEVISPRDRSRKKFDFYARVGVRELFLVDRKPWTLELYRLDAGTFHLVGKSTLEQPEILVSGVLPLTFQLQPSEARPRIEIVHSDGVQRWSA